jgi:hypothetical protein
LASAFQESGNRNQETVIVFWSLSTSFWNQAASESGQLGAEFILFPVACKLLTEMHLSGEIMLQ